MMFKKIFKHILIFPFLILLTGNLLAQDEQNKCLNCHKKLISFNVIHPVAEDACDNCHQENGENHPGTNGNEFSLVEQVPNLCYMCHETLNTKSIVHQPIVDGYCWMCHSPHASNNLNLLTENPVQKTCKRCHDLEIPKTDNIHKPVKEGSCNFCHDPHQSDISSLLKENKPQLCFNCHKNVEEQSTYGFIHYPFDDDCSNCHKAHNSSEKYLLTEKSPNVCFNCHDVYQAENSGSIHSVLFDEKSCANCHSPHGSKLEHLLANSGNELCLSCHNKEIKTDTKRIENIKGKIDGGKSVHAALEMDGCATCHKPHNSEFPFLLSGNYPKLKYVSAEKESFALCFECHDSEILSNEYTDITNFRNGDINLHYLHIQGKKGRSCSLCHDMHGSSNEHLIKEESKFGSWDMEMNYVVTNNGGSCFPGCHGEESYKR